MAQNRLDRRLSAVLAADVASYSRLIGLDEEETVSALTAHRTEIFKPTITHHRGRLVKTMGDGLLVELPSVVDAVRCAVDVQRAMATRNAEVAADRRIEFRMGIHVGDVVIEQNDIFGDGVNIAARLEATRTCASPRSASGSSCAVRSIWSDWPTVCARRGFRRSSGWPQDR